MVLSTVTVILDWFGVIVFAITGALVASRKQMDLVGFALLGTVTGVGGGTIRDVLLGRLPVFWVDNPAYLVTCVLVSCLAFFTAHIPQSRYIFLLWLDAIGLALFAVTGAERAMLSGAGSIVAIAMGVITATFGGIVRDVLGGESPVILEHDRAWLNRAGGFPKARVSDSRCWLEREASMNGTSLFDRSPRTCRGIGRGRALGAGDGEVVWGERGERC
jgi:uncharacterized membrane protein YeiH